MFFNQEWERLHSFETEFVKIIYYDFDENFADMYHSYDYHRVCTIIEGEKRVRIDEEEDFIYTDKEYVLLAPHSKVHMTMPVKTKAMVLELNDNLINDVSHKLALEYDYYVDLKDYGFYHSGMTGLLNQTMSSIKQSLNMGEMDRRFLIDLAAQKLTYSLLKEEGARCFLKSNSHEHPMQKAIELIKDNKTKDLKITQLAGELHMSVSAFSNKFKKYYGVSPKQYVRDYKLLQAKAQLKKKSVGEVAFELGYQNVSYFIDLFKKKFGITPKQYQLRHIANMTTPKLSLHN